MMGGDPDSEAGLAHASDLVDQTAAARASRATTAPTSATTGATTARHLEGDAPRRPQRPGRATAGALSHHRRPDAPADGTLRPDPRRVT